MSNETDNLRSQLDQATKQLKNFESALSRNTRSSTIADSALKESADITKELAESEREFGKTISGAMSGLTGFARSLANSQGSFAPLTSAISLSFKLIGKVAGMFPVVGTALKGVAEGAGEVATYMVESFDKAYSTFEKISDSGVVSTFTEMKQSARALQLNYDQTESVLTKHSKNLALFSGSAAKGRQTFEAIAYDSYELRKQFQKLGISGEEFSDMQLNYINQQNRMGKNQSKTTDELIAGSIKYIKELDNISKLTGLSKKDLQSMREARQNDPQFRAGMMDIADDMMPTIHSGLDIVAGLIGKPVAEGIQSYMQSGPSGEKASKFISALGNSASAVMASIDKFRKGSIDIGTLLNQTAPLLAQAANAQNYNVKTSMKAGDIMEYFVSFKNAELLQGKDFKKLIEDERKKQEQILKDKESDNAKLAETKTKLENAGREIELMSTSGKLVTGLMNHMATGLELVTEKLYEMNGEDLPAHLKAKKDERNALKAELAARKKLKDAESGKTGKIGIGGAKFGLVDSILTMGGSDTTAVWSAKKQLEQAIKDTDAARERRIQVFKEQGIDEPPQLSNANNGNTNNSPTQTNNVSYGDASDYEGLNIGGAFKGEAVQGGPASKNIIALARKMQAKYPGGVFNAFNDSFHKGGAHKQGLAFDYSLPNYPKGEKIPKFLGEEIVKYLRMSGASSAIDEYNNPSAEATGGHIHAEVSARTGGIFSGPESGYLAELHGDESVSSVGDGSSVSKTALGSGSMMTKSSNKISEIYTTLVEKMDSLIDLMDTSMENQKKFLEAKLN